MTVVLMYTVAH